MVIRSGAAKTEAGTVETSAGGGGGADSAPSPLSSWTITGWGEVALGGLSPKDSPPCFSPLEEYPTIRVLIIGEDLQHPFPFVTGGWNR